VVRLTLLYSPAVQGKDFKEQATQDWGRHEFVYGLSAHWRDWRWGKTDWQAARLEQPMYVFETSAHPGHLGRSYSGLELSSDQVAVRALKLAEDTDEVIVRLQELNGRSAERIKLRFGAPIVSAVEVNGLEKTIAPVKNTQAGQLNFKPYQLRSLAYRLKQSSVAKPLASVPVEIPFNLDVFSYNENRRDGGCDDVGTTFPAETMSDVLTVEDVKFTLGSREDGQLNAVRCEGQQIALPEGSFDSIYLLATAAHGDFEGEFAVDSQKTTLRVQDWSGYIGQWYYRRFEGSVKEMTYGVNNPLKEITTAYIKRAPVAWFSTHRHNRDGRDEGYAYSYLYKHRLAAAPGAKTLTLPNSPRIRILAVTAVNSGGEARPCHPLYDDLTDHKPVVLRNEIAAQQATHHP
jgi:alpha-mannosidase